MNKIRKNYIYNLVYQIFLLITPLIVTPYVSRVLGSAGVGQHSFTYSLVTYFVLLGSLGFNVYAQREIARYQGDKEKQSLIFWEIFLARLISVGVSLAIYLGIAFSGVYGDTYSKLMFILTINVVATAFDITYLFQGNEQFGIIALRNIIIKCIGIAAILIFVKNESHVWLYTLCQSVILIVSNLSLWTRLPKVLTHVSTKELNIKRHFVPTLRLFIPTIAVSVYTMLDKTLIGVLIPGTTTINGIEYNISDIENGYYEQSEKLVKMAMTIVTSLGTVMIPRNSQAIAAGNTEEFNKNINGALKFVFFIGVPIMFGLAAVAKNLSPWFFGSGYEKVPNLIMMFSPLILIIGLSNVLGLQYLIPMKKDRKYTIAITSGAALNLLLNLLLIRNLMSYGACIATLCAEIVVTTIMFIFAKNDISFFKTILNSWKYIVSGGVMFGIVYLTQHYLSASAPFTLLLVLEGIVIYFSLLLCLKDDIILSFLKKNRKTGSQ